MSAHVKGFLLGLAALAFTLAAKADEDAVKLKAGDNLEIVEQNCTACHSLDYIQMNSPFLDQKGWQAEVAKMVNAFKAPIAESDQQKIIEYLSAHYAKE
jgi:mono/diheme cytochrome c family protein